MAGRWPGDPGEDRNPKRPLLSEALYHADDLARDIVIASDVPPTAPVDPNERAGPISAANETIKSRTMLRDSALLPDNWIIRT
jgi:hypothetical protein